MWLVLLEGIKYGWFEGIYSINSDTWSIFMEAIRENLTKIIHNYDILKSYITPVGTEDQ